MKIFNKVLSFCSERAKKYGAPYVTFGIFGLINFPVSYLVHTVYGIVGKAESLPLRMLATLLCALLLLKNKWPDSCKKFLPLYWYLTVTFTPFLITYLLFNNHFSMWWLMNYAIGVLIVILIVDWLMFLITFIIGAILGAGSYLLINWPLEWETNRENITIAIYMYTLIFVLGTFFSRNKEIFAANLLHTKDELNKELELKVEQRTEELKTSLDANNYFLRNVNHEIRTPIQVVTGITSGLLDHWKDFSDKRRLELVMQIDEGAKRLFDLVTDVLDISKFKANKMLFDMKEQDLTHPIKQVIHELEPLGDFKKLKIKFGQDTLDTKTNFDHERIMQVARNLISNAIKFATESTEINVLLHQQEIPAQEGRKIKSLCVGITNQGSPIPENELITIFDPFMQSTIKNSKAKGTGLGLSIAAEIVHAHHGRIWAENNIGANSVTFYFAIPVHSIQMQSLKPITLRRNKDKKIHILCVDDEEGCQTVISMLLDSKKHEIINANNGIEALKYLEKHAENIDLILLDMLMPGKSGLQVLVELKSSVRYRNIPVLIQSGINQDPELSQALSIGAIGHISKPYVKENVLRQIDEVFADA